MNNMGQVEAGITINKLIAINYEIINYNLFLNLIELIEKSF